jgi:hypothetical protein
MPALHEPSAANPKPTVVCIAIVVPLSEGMALMTIPDVKAPESDGTVRA